MKIKRIIALSAFVFSFAVAGCGKQADSTSVNGNASDNTEAVNKTDISVSDIEEAQDDKTSVDQEAAAPAPIEDGVYTADFITDSTMFHVNEALDGKGILTVKDGIMTIHILLPSKSVLNLYPGLAEDAAKEGAELLNPSVEEATYPDGLTEEVHAFDIPVPYLDDDFDVALIGKKDTWYDHKVSVTNPEPYAQGNADGSSASDFDKSQEGDIINVSLEGGSGKASIISPAAIKETDGVKYLVIEWSSPNYDYMIVDDIKYLPVNEDGNSVFEIPVDSFDAPLHVIADTVAMSTPHEVEYTISFTD